MTIGERIKKAREAKGISQTDLANAVKVSKQSLYKYENNIITNIPSDKIEAISYYLEVSPAFIMGWEMESDKKSDLLEEKDEINETNNINLVKIAGRDGRYIEKRLTDEQVKALEAIIEQLPDAPDDL